jgi:Cdc6-like AAA superfamily ATPase
LAEEVSEALKDLTDDTVIVVLGPTGEGKSVALKQVGIDYASDPEVEVLQVETATATLSQEFIAELRSRDRPILLLIDEADLILDAVCASLRNADSAGNQILVVACMHSQFEHKVDYWKREIGVWRVVRFDGLDADSDAGALARYWQRNGSNSDGLAGARGEVSLWIDA